MLLLLTHEEVEMEKRHLVRETRTKTKSFCYFLLSPFLSRSANKNTHTHGGADKQQCEQTFIRHTEMVIYYGHLSQAMVSTFTDALSMIKTHKPYG